ncbi:MAG: tripartite tricarboxylate transporter substrate binding protein [Burkholderiales bacterium]|jgi:tripartite-type tricarboxylate transporter receptor subunit TctC|nr:tripartite tricarboxylate transporter substrate binding protein [Burkholderiales bacterium]
MSFNRAARLALAATLALACQSGFSQSWPTKPIQLVIPYPPGGVLDNFVRPMADALGKELGQPVVVDNRAGANGIIGTTRCAKAPADGYTLCIGNGDIMSLNPQLYSRLSYNPRTELVPVVRMANMVAAIVVPASLNAKNLAELAALDKAAPGKVNWGTFGTGSTSHVFLTEYNRVFGTSLTHVPYNGSAPLMQGLIAGDVQSAMLAHVAVAQYIDTGKLRAIAVMGEKRSDYFPGVQTITEQKFDFSGENWIGMTAPAGTPVPILERVNAAVNKILADPTFRRRSLEAAGLEPVGGSRDSFAQYLTREQALWAQLISHSKIRLD